MILYKYIFWHIMITSQPN